MRALSNSIRKVDLFGKLLLFEDEENQKFTTGFGVIMTFIILIICCAACFLFGQEIYQRKNPTVLNSNEKIANSTITLKEFPIFFSFIDDYGFNIHDATDYISFELIHMVVPLTGMPKQTAFYNYKKCKVNEFSELYQPAVQAIYSASSYDVYCINFNDDLYFQNEFSNPGSAFVSIRLNLTQSDDEQFLKRQSNLLENLYIMLVYPNSYVDSSNYFNPVNYYTYIQTQRVSKGLLQRRFVNIERLKLITHKGWLFENIGNEEVLTTRSFTVEVTNTNSNADLYKMTFSSPNIRTKIIRTYMKIQDLFAKIGGFFNALFIAATIFSKNYVDFSFYKHIYQHFYKFKNPENAFTRTNKSMVHQHPIDKIATKYAAEDYRKVSQISARKILSSNIVAINYKNEISPNKSNIYPQDIELKNNSNNVENKYSTSNIKIQNVSNSNNQLVNRSMNNINIMNNVDKSDNDVSSNNNKLNNETNYQNINSFLSKQYNTHNNAINSKDNLKDNYKYNNNNEENISEKENKNSITNDINKVAIKINSNKLTLAPIITNKFDIETEFYSRYNISYSSYFWNDLLCRKSIFKYQLQAVKKVLSFNHLLEVNYDHFINTDASIVI